VGRKETSEQLHAGGKAVARKSIVLALGKERMVWQTSNIAIYSSKGWRPGTNGGKSMLRKDLISVKPSLWKLTCEKPT
jgi:hypothetical protein